MEARTLLDKIRSRGFTIKAVGNSISLAPKKLLNDRMVCFVRERKEELLTALYQELDERESLHRERMHALGCRVQVLRVLVRRLFEQENNNLAGVVGDQEVEDFLDRVIRCHSYDLEAAIDVYRALAPSLQEQLCGCGYQPPFCARGGVFRLGVVICSACKHFTPDSVGDGAGIGLCQKGIHWTEEAGKRVVLYRYTNRSCDKFSAIIT